MNMKKRNPPVSSGKFEIHGTNSNPLLTKAEKEVWSILNDRKFWSPPSIRSIANILKKSPTGVYRLLQQCRRKGFVLPFEAH